MTLNNIFCGFLFVCFFGLFYYWIKYALQKMVDIKIPVFLIRNDILNDIKYFLCS